MEKTIKLIASDLDGTLLLHGQTKCNPKLFPLIEVLTEKGVYFMPASGRQYPSLQRLFSPVKDKIMYLCENGALVMHLDQVLMKRQFADDLALHICHEVMEHKDCEVLISGERTSYIIPKDNSFTPYIRDDIGNNITVIDKPEQIEEPIMKVSYYTPADKRDKATEDFKREFKDSCLIVTSGNRWVDFAPLGTSKGAALKVIGEKLGIRPEEMVAFGDNENDRTMLEFVGHPYLMEECNPTMRDVKAKTCHSVEDSLQEILERL